MAPGVGIEPTIAESKSVVLPLHYPGIILVARTRIELVIIAYQATVIPFNYPAETGGNSWTRTNDRLRMKQLH